jgi:hypothetical protein
MLFRATTVDIKIVDDQNQPLPSRLFEVRSDGHFPRVLVGVLLESGDVAVWTVSGFCRQSGVVTAWCVERLLGQDLW